MGIITISALSTTANPCRVICPSTWLAVLAFGPG
jgi:hypothetical protein